VSGIRAGSAGDFDEVSRIVTRLEPSGYSLVHRDVESVAAWGDCVVLSFVPWDVLCRGCLGQEAGQLRVMAESMSAGVF
jgi:hypothetical protein